MAADVQKVMASVLAAALHLGWFSVQEGICDTIDFMATYTANTHPERLQAGSTDTPCVSEPQGSLHGCWLKARHLMLRRARMIGSPQRCSWISSRCAAAHDLCRQQHGCPACAASHICRGRAETNTSRTRLLCMDLAAALLLAWRMLCMAMLLQATHRPYCSAWLQGRSSNAKAASISV